MRNSFHSTVITYDNVLIEENACIGEYSIIGKPYRIVNKLPSPAKRKTIIAPYCQIGSYVIIGEGTNIGSWSIVEDYAKTEKDVLIGSECKIIYGSQICNEAIIGNDCVIAGFICERAKIGNKSRIFGSLIHSQTEPYLDWDDNEESSPILENNVFVGKDAIIIGEVTLGEYSYICAGATITKDVPPFHIGFGINKIIPHHMWKGKLSKSKFFAGG